MIERPLSSFAGAQHGYRPDIDGLRAIAVLTVLLFHVGVKGFGGGFIGVDVFFVISGYLITGNIKADLDVGRFSFVNFYVRRARRLFPALFVTLAATFIAGVVWFSPEHLERLGQSLVYAIVSLSNFYFWSQAGYFDVSADYKPLLHTWSLAVEEQFYLVWPLLFFLLAKARRQWLVPAFLAAVAILSLYVTQYLLRTDPEGAFYLAPSRIVELAIGALCVWLAPHIPPARIVRDIMAGAGLAIIAAVTLAYSRETVFPGLSALAPCAGAALIILAGNPKTVGALINNRAAVGIGLISYSLYLVHWPILVFYKYVHLTPIVGLEKTAVIAASFAAAAAMHFAVERPIRFGEAIRRWRPAPFAAACAGLALLLIGAGSGAWAGHGWPGRVPDAIAISKEQRETLRAASWGLDEDNNRRAFPVKGERNILVIGDSFSRDVTNALLLNGTPAHVYNRALDTNCQPVANRDGVSTKYLDTPGNRENCDAGFAETLTSPMLTGADVVILAANWTPWGVDKLPETLAALKRHSGAAIVVFGPRMAFEDVPTLLSKFGKRAGAEAYVNGFQLDPAARYAMNERIRELATAAGAGFIDMLAVFCPEKSCPILTNAGQVVVYDEAHLTLEGAQLLGAKLRTSGTAEVLFR